MAKERVAGPGDLDPVDLARLIAGRGGARKALQNIMAAIAIVLCAVRHDAHHLTCVVSQSTKPLFGDSLLFGPYHRDCIVSQPGLCFVILFHYDLSQNHFGC